MLSSSQCQDLLRRAERYRELGRADEAEALETAALRGAVRREPLALNSLGAIPPYTPAPEVQL